MLGRLIIVLGMCAAPFAVADAVRGDQETPILYYGTTDGIECVVAEKDDKMAITCKWPEKPQKDEAQEVTA